MSSGSETSARLVEYDPTLDVAVDRGDVFEQLARLSLRQQGDAQAKIHSRIVQAGNGHPYSCVDERYT